MGEDIVVAAVGCIIVGIVARERVSDFDEGNLIIAFTRPAIDFSELAAFEEDSVGARLVDVRPSSNCRAGVVASVGGVGTLAHPPVGRVLLLIIHLAVYLRAVSDIWGMD